MQYENLSAQLYFKRLYALEERFYFIVKVFLPIQTYFFNTRMYFDFSLI